MTLRTPRRRISPRTKRRYRAIKDFIRRALGTPSQPDFKTNSSIQVSVSDLKNKIVGIEQQLHNVSKHCRDLSCLEHSFRSCRNLNTLDKSNDETDKEISDKSLRETKTKLIYKTSQSQYRNTDESENALNVTKQNDYNMTSRTQMFGQKAREPNANHINKNKEYNENILNERKGRSESKYDTFPKVYSTSSFHSLIESANKHNRRPVHSDHRRERKHYEIKDNIEPVSVRETRNRETPKRDIEEYRVYDRKPRKHRRVYSQLDEEYIADIIKRQYRPVKLFGRRDSEFSQFSAPVCRDQEFVIREDILEGSELCSCCYEEHRKHKHRHDHHCDLSDMRSICDARLYSAKKNRRYKYARDRIADYNNSAFYDIVPVKEKSSPKSRRKFAEDNMIAYQYYKEVPPSPRSHRPQLNLKAQQYMDYEESLTRGEQGTRKKSPVRQNYKVPPINVCDSDVSSDTLSKKRTHELNMKNSKPTPLQEDVATMSSLQYPNFANEQNNITNNDTTLNTQATDLQSDKTDKTLNEIKDILQSFLQEIKKESIHSENSDITNKIDNKTLNDTCQDTTKINTSFMPNSGHNFNNYTVGQCSVPPFLPSFPNPCCYPILPICPMNCMQNGYIIPSTSYTSTACANNSKDRTSDEKESPHNNRSKDSEELTTNNETQELIREIYKFVSQSPKTPRKKAEYLNDGNDDVKNELCRLEKKYMTSRSVGGSTKNSRHDANVGTPNMKCFSKSCEALGSRLPSETYTPNASYSDTVLEKMSLEATQSSTESSLSIENPKGKGKKNKFKKVLRSLGLLKKKKKDAIEELTESESTVEVEVKPKAPFKQHITNYAVHGQEYFHPPPIPGHNCYPPRHPDFSYNHHYDPKLGYISPRNDYYNHHTNHEHVMRPNCNCCVDNRPKRNSAPHYSNCEPQCNHQMQPQVPLCLKEIEVKSIGTQSERKVSILSKFTNLKPPGQQNAGLQYTTTAVTKEKPNIWKSLQEKARRQNPDPIDFSLKTQKQLAQGDMKLRNAMMKKLFYKRNPFSPRNLIVRTLLGKDRSSFGDPPKMYKPKMFL